MTSLRGNGPRPRKPPPHHPLILLVALSSLANHLSIARHPSSCYSPRDPRTTRRETECRIRVRLYLSTRRSSGLVWPQVTRKLMSLQGVVSDCRDIRQREALSNKFSSFCYLRFQTKGRNKLLIIGSSVNTLFNYFNLLFIVRRIYFYENI